MFAQVARASSRLALLPLRQVARTNGVAQVRGFIAPTVSRRADFVQELYLKELKAYKPVPPTDADADGQVKPFSLPKTPASPEEADLASSLKEYESLSAEVEGQDAGAVAGAGAHGKSPLPDWFEEEPEDDKAQH